MAGKIKKRVSHIPVRKLTLKERIKKDLKKNYLLYLMLLPGIFILICFKSVSYTHLDVYKRQKYSSVSVPLPVDYEL